MAETNVSQNEQNNDTPAAADKTFTQAELDVIISDRLRREREKYADYEDLKTKAAKFDAAEEASKTELQKATEKANELQTRLDSMLKADNIRQIREKVAKETSVPAELLSGEDEESCKAQAKKILEFAKPAGYPNVRDGGEIPTSSGTSGEKTRDQFADWFDKQLNK